MKNNVINYDPEYIIMFWLGLMDAYGSIQVNCFNKNINKNTLDYRLFLKLKNIKSNYNMLINIAKVLNGLVIVINNKKDVIWVLDLELELEPDIKENKKNKDNIDNIMYALEKYPPLTSKLQCQLTFFKIYLSNNSAKDYIKTINLKNSNQLSVIRFLNLKFITPNYFACWLSGFIKAKGCLSITKKSCHFSIAHGDYYILDAIKQFFLVTNKIKNSQKNTYILKIYNHKIIKKIINHCNNY